MARHQENILKSSRAMLNGTECWHCKKSLSVVSPNSKGRNPKMRGPRYCDKCLREKRKGKLKKWQPVKTTKPVFEDD